MIVIGFDPGLTGAVSILRDERLLDVQDLPICDNGHDSGSMRNWIDVPRLGRILSDWSARFDLPREDVMVAVERPIPMPSLPAQTIASQFDTFGAIRALALIKGWPTHIVTPHEWKRLFGLKSAKDDSRACCQRLYPKAPVTTKKHHNRAEAVLIGHWLMQKVNG